MQVNHTMTQLMTELETLRAEVERQDREIERLRGVEQDAAEWVEERTKRLRADNERLRAALRKLHDIIDPGTDDAPMPSRDYVMSSLEAARRALERKDEE